MAHKESGNKIEVTDRFAKICIAASLYGSHIFGMIVGNSIYGLPTCYGVV